MTFEAEQQFIADIKNYISDNFPLSKLSDEELQEKIEETCGRMLQGRYISIEQRVSVVEQVYSSIRGFGLLDAIIKDDTITEVMINGPENIFIERKGRLLRLDKQFESQRRLEDVIQRIVGLAGQRSESGQSHMRYSSSGRFQSERGAAARGSVRAYADDPKVFKDAYDH